MKLLVIDSFGMVGQVVTTYLTEAGHLVEGFGGKEAYNQAVSGSLCDLNALTQVVEDGCFDAIINCSAIINNKAEEDKPLATYVNAFLPHFLESITKASECIVVHRSTDCIFSGKRGNYTTADVPDAQSFYAKTKALGELINDKDVTIRTSLIGPEQDKDGDSLFNWFFRQEGQVNGFANAIWTGITTLEYAKIVEQLISRKAHGLLHVVPTTAISKYELLCLFQKYFPAKRSIVKIDNKRVDKSLAPELGNWGVTVPQYEAMIVEMKEWIKDHLQLYPNYNK